MKKTKNCTHEKTRVIIMSGEAKTFCLICCAILKVEKDNEKEK